MLKRHSIPVKVFDEEAQTPPSLPGEDECERKRRDLTLPILLVCVFFFVFVVDKTSHAHQTRELESLRADLTAVRSMIETRTPGRAVSSVAGDPARAIDPAPSNDDYLEDEYTDDEEEDEEERGK